MTRRYRRRLSAQEWQEGKRPDLTPVQRALLRAANGAGLGDTWRSLAAQAGVRPEWRWAGRPLKTLVRLGLLSFTGREVYRPTEWGTEFLLAHCVARGAHDSDRGLLPQCRDCGTRLSPPEVSAGAFEALLRRARDGAKLLWRDVRAVLVNGKLLSADERTEAYLAAALRQTERAYYNLRECLLRKEGIQTNEPDDDEDHDVTPELAGKNPLVLPEGEVTDEGGGPNG